MSKVIHRQLRLFALWVSQAPKHFKTAHPQSPHTFELWTPTFVKIQSFALSSLAFAWLETKAFEAEIQRLSGFFG
jgi:hypothetical protein